MTRVAVIDCGTNSIRLLVADAQARPGVGGELRDVVRRMEIARLGEGVDRTGELADRALARTFAVIDDYAAQCRELGVERVRVVATSATRDASNREVFLEGVRERMGVVPEVLSGDEEAE
ncbi:MAG TPA: exopolyphosphatase, partial [Actinomycetales bacterium]|nr:exopolyphosphatase [Actinomycetales bacterium]